MPRLLPPATLSVLLHCCPAGIKCQGTALYVQCCCSKCCEPAAAAPAAGSAGSSSSTCKLFGLEDWVEQHAGGPVIPSDDDAEAERLVRSTVTASSSSWEPQVGHTAHISQACRL
jgi:hypothetical protein